MTVTLPADARQPAGLAIGSQALGKPWVESLLRLRVGNSTGLVTVWIILVQLAHRNTRLQIKGLYRSLWDSNCGSTMCDHLGELWWFVLGCVAYSLNATRLGHERFIGYCIALQAWVGQGHSIPTENPTCMGTLALGEPRLAYPRLGYGSPSYSTRPF